MEEWTVFSRLFPNKDKAEKAANTIRVTESRLLSSSTGPQYDIETEVTDTGDGWQVRWRKVLTGYGSGCKSCGSCDSGDDKVKKNARMGKVIQFRPRQIVADINDCSSE